MHPKIIVPLLLAGAFPAGSQSPAIGPGSGFEVERYAVALRPDLATTAVSGTETIIVRGTSDRLAQLSFTPNSLQISDATVDGVPVQVSSSTNGITFSLPHGLRAGTKATLRFRFAGVPARGVTAVAGSIYSSYFACDWMVCLQDAPGDKAHMALDLFLPDGVQSVGVGKPAPKTRVPGGLTLHRWRSTRPYPPYLYAFAAGRLARWATPTPHGELVYFDGSGTTADAAGRFAQTPAMAAFFADKAGLPLPDRRYMQVLVPGREAQESASFSLIGLAELERERDDRSTAWIIAHEMAHQWWGNLVTCATWQDFWLNEGIATFMVAAWKEHSSGESAYRQDLDLARRRLERAREIGFDKPLAWSGAYPSLTARRAVQYSKGALFLAHLRESLGDTAFWDGLRRFTRRHAGGTVTSKDFQDAMEEASSRDLSPTFIQWVYGDSGQTAESGLPPAAVH